MKENFWRFLVFCYSFFPVRFRTLLCRLSFEVDQKRQAEKGLRELILLHDALLYYIDQSAIHYDNGIHPKHRLTRYHQFFVDRLEPGMRVIDVGCGIGAVAYSLSCAGARVTAIDIEKKSIDFAKKHFQHDNLTFVCGDVLNKLPGKRYDVAVLSNFLEHIEDRISLLKALATRLRPALFLIRVPVVNSHWLVPMKRELGLPYFSDSTHFTEYTVESFSCEIQEAGMEIKDLQVNWGEIWAEVIKSADSNGVATGP